MKAEILKLLKEQEGYLSGQALCERFGVSRTAVWKVIRQLIEEGYQIEAVRNKGYHLADTIDVMTQTELLSCIRGKWAGHCIEYHDEITSTNTRAKQLAEEGAPHGTLVIADSQTSGKGRRGRSWASPSGTGIWMSLILRPDIVPSSASMITLAAALSVVRGIETAVGIKTLIKWPNDIVSDGKKVCGVLTEMSAELEGVHYIVVGMGINANMDTFPPDISQTATSLYLQAGKKVRRSRVVVAVMESMELYYDKFLRSGDLSQFRQEYHSKLVNKGQIVRVLSAKEEYQGICLGIDQRGELLVQMEDGSVRNVVSGEVSVRGVYGYV